MQSLVVYNARLPQVDAVVLGSSRVDAVDELGRLVASSQGRGATGRRGQPPTKRPQAGGLRSCASFNNNFAGT